MMDLQRLFIRFALALLLLTVIAGVLASFAFLFPANFNTILPFHELRPVHASAALFWIITGAACCVSYFSGRQSKAFMVLWMLTIVVIFVNYGFQNYGGREYWEFPAYLNLPLLAAWLFFMAVFMKRLPKGAPVYYWMWTTGILFFLITFLEQNLWHIPWFRQSFLREVTIQWKANGSMVGAWNQMINGLSVYLLVAISGNAGLARQKKPWFLFFLGLFNLMFNWGHHVYNVPNSNWMRGVAYGVSMTEWVIIILIIRDFRHTLTAARKFRHLVVYRFISAAELWVAANLLLALMMSIPAINRYTHGTHITVAHAMGTTIGINTMLLLAAFGYILDVDNLADRTRKWLQISIRVNTLSLGIFWVSLIIAGLVKGILTVDHPENSFFEVMAAVRPYLEAFTAAGLGVMIALGVICVIYLKHSQRKQTV
ncbi:cbb3-type cytochrome c oxidase subunit I [Chitinophaga silvisoli]|uniref:Cytochrome C oxidase subunit I n=1 Tax=Chitinophaga silvisoli TaxID=2291814 RepID=A0A3E1NTJ2_9BACT|nr:cbb3-type cytochrome c oxidase subunit I [Chitinophaga silvisoli]RFM31242.1 cytochrome C oxidase subunit I [Chitinophaga silvisoli]